MVLDGTDFKGFVKLTKAQFDILSTEGSLTIGEETLTFDPISTIYVTVDETNDGETDFAKQSDIDSLKTLNECSLYNLGAYDTYTINDNDTVTINRKTGVYVANNVKSSVKLSGNTYGYRISTDTSLYSSNSTVDITCKTNFDGITAVTATNQFTNNLTNSIAVHSDGVVIVTDGIQNKINSFIVEYLLPESKQYTENVIKNQPINLSNKQYSNYAFCKWPTNDTLILGPNESTEYTLTVITTGRPVFISVTGNIDPTADGQAWVMVELFIDGTKKATTKAESHGSTWNIPFVLNYLDITSSGTHTYRCKLSNLSNTSFRLAEDGAIESPQFMAFEI